MANNHGGRRSHAGREAYPTALRKTHCTFDLTNNVVEELDRLAKIHGLSRTLAVEKFLREALHMMPLEAFRRSILLGGDSE